MLTPFKALDLIASGGVAALTPEQAIVINSRLWELGAEVGRLRAALLRIGDRDAVKRLHEEADKLVAQVVSEEQARVAAEVQAERSRRWAARWRRLATERTAEREKRKRKKKKKVKHGKRSQ